MKKYRVTISKASYRMPRYPAIVSQRYKGKQNLQRVFLSDISIVKYSSMEEAIQKEKRKKKKMKNEKEKKEKEKEKKKKIWMEQREKPVSWSRFEGNSSFNATRFIGESFNRTEFIIPRAKVCGNRKAPNTQMGFVGRFPVGNPKVSGFKFQLVILGQAECFGFAVFPPLHPLTTIRVTPPTLQLTGQTL